MENRQYELLPGATEAQDELFVSVWARRPVFESALRRAVEDEANINLITNTRVVGLVSAHVSRGDVRVTGARTDSGEEIEADLVVDALGRTSPLVSWLTSLGARPPLERRAECGLIYYSRHFRFRPGVEMPTVRSLHRVPRGEIGYMAFGMFIEDNRTFALVLMIPPWERELRMLRFEKAYMAAALAMPSLVPWVHPDQSEAITPVLPMGSLQNVHRSLMLDGEPVAVGIQPVGDALCHTNPTFAYGASLSIHHGFTLAGSPAEATTRVASPAPSTLPWGQTPPRDLMSSRPRIVIGSGTGRRADRRSRADRQHGSVPANDRLPGRSERPRPLPSSRAAGESSRAG